MVEQGVPDRDASLTRVGIGLMCKPPRIGVSKTRLAVAVGPQRAAELSAAFLADTAATLEALAQKEAVELFAFFSPPDAGAEMRALLPDQMAFYAQDPAGLGQAMLAALRLMLVRNPAGAIVIGADSPTLPLSHLVQAVQRLRVLDDGAVFGPAEDGGYYLAGIKNEGAAPLFAPMAWSTPDVMAETRRRAARHGIRISELPIWYDVDDAASLIRLKDDLRDNSTDRGAARATRLACGL